MGPGKVVIHEVQRYRELVRLAGAESDQPMPVLEIPSASLQTAEQLIPRDESKIPIAVHPGSGSPLAYKRWGADNFANLIDRLAANLDCRFYLFGGPEEIDLAREIARRTEVECAVLAGETDLMTTIACLSRCDVLVSNDSGVSHLADTVNLKGVTLFGPTSEFKNRPTTEGSVIVRADVSMCAPERENICEVCAPAYLKNGAVPRCLNDLSVERVSDVVLDLIR